MAETKLCVCPQCGKKYQLKEGFAAKSFSCKSCSATVWVAGKPDAPAPTGARAARRPGGRAPAAHGKGRAAAAGPRGRTRGRREEAAEEPQEQEEGRRGRRGYQKKKDNTGLVIAAVGGVVVVGIVLFLVLGGKDDEPVATTPAETAQAKVADEPAAAPGAGTKPAAEPDALNPTPETPKGETPADTPEGDGEAEAPKPPPKKLDNRARTPEGFLKSKFDPPTDIPHVEGTPEDVKKQIDELITVMFDQDAGIDSHHAKKKLIALGKPSFPRILAKMASVRDTITDVDSMEERLLESSLMLADDALREMDGYLEANSKSKLRPGSEKKYIAYICRLHYKRWVQVLEAMPEMPGPFDPTKAYEAEAEEYDSGK
jgi:hypothetical protein